MKIPTWINKINLLNKLKLATKIQWALGFIIILMLCLSIVAFSAIQKISAANNFLYQNVTMSVTNTSEMVTTFLSIRLALRDAVLAANPQEQEEALNKIEEGQNYLTTLNDGYEQYLSTKTYKDNFSHYQAKLKDYDNTIIELKELLNQGHPDLARAAMYNDKNKKISTDVKEALDTLMMDRVEEGEKTNKKNLALAKLTNYLLIILASVIIGLALFIALYLTLNIRKILHGFKQELDQLISCATAGQLDQRANVDNINFEFRPIAAGLNQTLDVLIAPLNVAADYVRRIAEGDIPEQITDTYNGDFNTLKNNLNTCITAIKKLITDTNILNQAAVNGELKTRTNAEQHQGDFRKIVDGINQTLDAVIGPLTIASTCIEHIALGLSPELIATDYKGDFNEIKTNLNMLIHSNKVVGQAAMDLAAGNLSIDLEPRSEQDFMVIALNTMVAAIKTIVEDINQMTVNAVKGELDSRIDATRHKGEYSQLVSGLNKVMDAIANPLKETSRVLQAAARRDLSQRITSQYQGQIEELKNNVNTTIEALDKALSEVSETVMQVTSGGEQIADASQSLSQGATEQASSLEEITSSMAEIGSQTRINAENANQANILSKNARLAAETGQEKMHDMVSAMEEISSSSLQIGRIIKVIDEIAFQTNLLALNAAVEAARAGRHGKGFAVVADEVRNLASRSAKAAKETADLIESSKNKVKTGNDIAEGTSLSFKEIVNSIQKVTDIVGEIAAASSEQAQGVIQINQGLSQIDKVTQQNTANAEETAAAAEELSSQAMALQNMTRQFTLSGVSPQAPVRETAKKSSEIPVPKPKPTASGWGTSTKPKISLDDNDFGRF